MSARTDAPHEEHALEAAREQVVLGATSSAVTALACQCMGARRRTPVGATKARGRRRRADVAPWTMLSKQQVLFLRVLLWVTGRAPAGEAPRLDP